jgi:hypothetical protein
MDGKALLRGQVAEMHRILEQAIGDCQPAMASNCLPGAKINSIGAIYAHTVFGEDGILHGAGRGITPIYFSGGWSQKVGLEMPQGGLEPDWNPSIDLGLFREYAAAVYAETDSFLASASDEDLAREINLGFVPPMPLSTLIANVLVWHTATHQGEISALKGVQGVDGLVFSH